MRKIFISLLTAGLFVCGFAVPVFAQEGPTVNVFDQCTDVDVDDSAVCQSRPGGAEEASLTSMAEIIVNTLFILIGMVAVVMIVIGGFRYTLSRGEASEIKTAKDIILYSAVGLIIAIMAYTIVNFVLGWF